MTFAQKPTLRHRSTPVPEVSDPGFSVPEVSDPGFSVPEVSDPGFSRLFLTPAFPGFSAFSVSDFPEALGQFCATVPIDYGTVGKPCGSVVSAISPAPRVRTRWSLGHSQGWALFVGNSKGVTNVFDA